MQRPQRPSPGKSSLVLTYASRCRSSATARALPQRLALLRQRPPPARSRARPFASLPANAGPHQGEIDDAFPQQAPQQQQQHAGTRGAQHQQEEEEQQDAAPRGVHVEQLIVAALARLDSLQRAPVANHIRA